jgi:predicted N-acetyltransferase YhbS
MLSVRIRDEQPHDIDAISELTRTAFATMPFSGGYEQDITNALRDDNALTVSLVAERFEEIVGHVAFSPVKIDGQPADWFALGPVSVKPGLQSQGIGSALIREGLNRIVDLEGHGCVLLGSPPYYRRFGFVHDPRLTYDGQVLPDFQRLTLAGVSPVGAVSFHSAFHP